MSEIATRHHRAAYDTHYEEADTHVSGWVGWVGFAGFLMVLSGIFQAIDGLVGIFRGSYYLVANGSNQLLVVNNVHTWGWINLIIGSIVVLAGISLFSGTTWSRVIAVFMAISAAIANMVAMSLYPVWSIIGITLSVLVMYAVIVHGGDLREE